MSAILARIQAFLARLGWGLFYCAALILFAVVARLMDPLRISRRSVLGESSWTPVRPTRLGAEDLRNLG